MDTETLVHCLPFLIGWQLPLVALTHPNVETEVSIVLEKALLQKRREMRARILR